MLTTSNRGRGRPRKPKRPCQTEGCGNTGRRYIEDKFVCQTCRKRFDRGTRNLCSVRGCDGQVKFAKNVDRPRFCRTHEQHYLLANTEDTNKALHHIGMNIKVHAEVGCWEYTGRLQHTGKSRASVYSDGLKWQVARFLYVWHFGGHRGGKELHHYCGSPWCVHPGHLVPISGKQNRLIESGEESWTELKQITRNAMENFAATTPDLDNYMQKYGLRTEDQQRTAAARALAV